MGKFKVARNQYQIEDLIYYEFLKPLYRDQNLVTIYELPDPQFFENYYTIIENPLSIRYIICKFYANKYQYWRRIKRDLQQLQDNWKKYFNINQNHPEKNDIMEILNQLTKYQQQFDIKLEKLLQKLDGSEDDEFIVVQDKIDLDFEGFQQLQNQIKIYQNKQNDDDQHQIEESSQQLSKNLNQTQKQKQKQKPQIQNQSQKKTRKSKYSLKQFENYNEDEENDSQNQEQQQQQNENIENNNNNADNYDLEERIYNHLLKPLYNNKQFELFQEPVDDTVEGLEEYYTVVKNPMCFNKIYEKLEKGEYTQLDQIMADLNLIKDNCILFNGEDNEYTKPRVDNYINALDKKYQKLLQMLDRAGTGQQNIDKNALIKPFDEYTMLSEEERQLIIQKEQEEERQREERKKKNSLLFKNQDEESQTESQYEGSSKKRLRNSKYNNQQNSSSFPEESSKNSKKLKKSQQQQQNSNTNISLQQQQQQSQNYENIQQQKQQTNSSLQEFGTLEPEIEKKVKFNENYSDVDVEEYEEVIDSMFPYSQQSSNDFSQQKQDQQQVQTNINQEKQQQEEENLQQQIIQNQQDNLNIQIQKEQQQQQQQIEQQN